MYAPVLVTAPSAQPFTLDELKKHLRVDTESGDEPTIEDTMIEAYQKAAIDHIERSCGVALEEQTWRIDFDNFGCRMRLPKQPAIAIDSVSYRNVEGQLATVAADDYALMSDSIGPYVRFKDAFSAPNGLYQVGAVSVTWTAGHAITPAVEADPETDPPVEAADSVDTVPPAIKAAILLMVGDLYENREAKVGNDIQENPTVKALLSTYRVF